MQAIEAVVAATEPARPTEIRVHDDPTQIVGGQSSRMVLETDVPEPMGRVTRLEYLVHVPRRRNLVDLERATGRVVPLVEEICLRDIPRAVKALSVDQGDMAACGSDVGQPHPTVDVLAEIGHLPIGSDSRDRDGPDVLDPADGWRGGPVKGPDASGSHRDRLPLLGGSDVVFDLSCDRVGRHEIAPHLLSTPSRSTRSTRRIRAVREMPACLRTRPFDDAYRVGPGTSHRTPRPPIGSTPGPGAPSRRRPGPAAGSDSW